MFSLVPWNRNRNSGALMQTDPFQLVSNEFQHLFDRFFGGLPGLAEGWETSRGWDLDVREKENGVVVRAELPGFDAKELDVQLTENVLTIEAKHDVECKEEGSCAHKFNHVRRSVTLPSGLDFEKLEATFKNGVLEIHVPRTPEAQSRKIEIKS